MSRICLACFVFCLAAFSEGRAFAQESDAVAVQAVMATPLQKSRAAIEECRERRLKKEIATYKDSAECSSPKIFAAWQESKYPHMDLITAWLNAREVASEKVDKGILTPAEFERQMADLTNRLTEEERRRRAGWTNLADNAVQTQVATIRTSPSERISDVSRSKPVPKRTVVASMQPIASPTTSIPSANTGIQSVGMLSKLDTAWNAPPDFAPVKPTESQLKPLSLDPKASAGVGGPYVTTRSGTSYSTRSSQVRSASLSSSTGEGGSTGTYVQVSAQRSEAEARVAFRTLQSTFPNVLANREAIVRRADLAGKGTYYRAQIGPLNSRQADELCSNLKAAGGQCFIQYN